MDGRARGARFDRWIVVAGVGIVVALVCCGWSNLLAAKGVSF